MISVVMPCLDEAAAVAGCIERALRGIAATGLSGEVVVVDNGSSDGSAEIARAAGARVISEPRRGYGSAYLRGFREARGQIIVMGDADGSYDFEDIPRFVEPLRAGAVDVVMGTRLKGKILPGAMPWSHRWIGNPVLSGMLKLLFRTSVSDSHCGLRSFTRAALDEMDLRTTGMELASEIVVKALRAKHRIAEVPITYLPRIGESKLEGFRDAWRHVRFMLLFSPSSVFQWPGLVLGAIGAVLVVLLAGGPFEAFGRRWDYHTLLLGCMMLLLGHSLVVFDVIAKAFSMFAGLARPGHWWARWPRFFTLERGLLAGSLAVIVGVGIEVKIFTDWARSGYGAMMAVRGITVGMTAMFLGFQTIFASFAVSLFQLRARDPREDDPER